MDRGRINDIPVWISVTDVSGGERTVIKEAPGVNGALVETQGQLPLRYRVDFTLIQDGEWIVDDYETASLDLRAMLLEGGPFTLQAPVIGEVSSLWLDGTYSLKLYDESKLLASDGSMTLIEADPQIVLSESAVANVESAISALSQAVALDFARRQTANGPFDGQFAELDAMFAWLDGVQSTIASAFEPVNDVVGSITALNSQVEQLLTTPQTLASQVMGTALQLLSLVPSLSSQGSTTQGSAAVQDPSTDLPAIVYIEALTSGAAFDAGVPTLQADKVPTPSDEDLDEVEEAEAAKQLALSAITLSVCLAITSTGFATVNSVLAVADALEPAFEALFNLPNIDARVYSNARAMRQATRQYLAETAAGLPRMLTYLVAEITDPFSVIPRLYDSLGAVNDDALESAVTELITINGLGDIDIYPGTVLRYLERVS